MDAKQWHTCPLPQALSVNKPFLHYWAREHGLKRDVSHLSTAIILPIRQDIFISIGRDVRPDWADSCALMERDNRLSVVRSHSCYPAIHFHYACQENGRHIFYWTSTHNLLQIRSLPSESDSSRPGVWGRWREWVIAWFSEKAPATIQQRITLCNFSSCEIHCCPEVSFCHIICICHLFKREEIEQIQFINLCWWKL